MKYTLKNFMNLCRVNRSHLIFIGLIIFLFLGLYYPSFSTTKNPLLDHYSTYYPTVEILRQSIEYGDYQPLWDIYKFGGRTYIGGLTPNIFSPVGLYLLITGSSLIAMKMWEFSTILIAGISMYFLINYLFKKPYLGFIAALVYMNNGYLLRYLNDGNFFTLTGYAFLPLLFYFFLRVFKSKDLVNSSVIFGIALGAFFWFSPDYKVFPFFMTFVGVYTLLYLANFRKTSLKRIIIFYLIFSLIFVGITLPKILPVKENVEGSWRGHFSYEKIQNSRRVKPSQLFEKLVEPIYEGMPKVRRELTATVHLGIIAFLLMIYGLYKKYKNRLVMALGISALISVLFAMGTPVLYLFWKFVPGFSSFRLIERGLVLFVVSGTILAAYGANEFINKFRNKKSVIAILILFLFLNLIVFNFKGYPEGEWVADLGKLNEENPMLKYISEQDGFFRYHPVESVGIGGTTEPFTIPYKIEQLFGYGSFWSVNYFNVFLGAAHRSPAKLWGIMNTKYVSSTTLINISGLKLIKTFENCTYCAPLEYVKIHGPYLYENEEFLPRAYNTKTSILVVGVKDAVTQLTYGVMLGSDFDPKERIIVFGKEKISDYELDELKKFDFVMLTQGSISGGTNEMSLLNQYVNNGGKLYPDVTKGENQISDSAISQMLTTEESKYLEIKDSDITRHNFDKISIRLDNKITGWLVLSEKFALLGGWEAYSGNKEFKIYRVTGVVSAIYLDGPVDSVVFEYKPRSWIVSRNILIFTLVVLAIYFGCDWYRKKKAKSSNN